MFITRKGAGTVISAVRSHATRPFKAARALVRRNLFSRADRWHSCRAYRDILKMILDPFDVNLLVCAETAASGRKAGPGCG
jgi:hypothetical protein